MPFKADTYNLARYSDLNTLLDQATENIEVKGHKAIWVPTKSRSAALSLRLGLGRYIKAWEAQAQPEEKFKFSSLKFVLGIEEPGLFISSADRVTPITFEVVPND